MAISLMNKKGFLLIDSLVSIVIVVSICFLCASTYQNVNNYHDGFDSYKEKIKQKYEDIYSSLGECEKCIIEEDSSLLEP